MYGDVPFLRESTVNEMIRDHRLNNAAGLLPLFNMSYSVGQIHKYSVRFYQELQEETGKDVGFRRVSNIRLACTQDRMDEYQFYAGVAETIGVDVRFLSPSEIGEIWPLCNTEGLVGAIQHLEDGYKIGRAHV